MSSQWFVLHQFGLSLGKLRSLIVRILCRFGTLNCSLISVCTFESFCPFSRGMAVCFVVKPLSVCIIKNSLKLVTLVFLHFYPLAALLSSKGKQWLRLIFFFLSFLAFLDHVEQKTTSTKPLDHYPFSSSPLWIPSFRLYAHSPQSLWSFVVLFQHNVHFKSWMIPYFHYVNHIF